MRVFLTGPGFIGSHLAERLVDLGHEVSVFAHYHSDGTLGWLDSSPVKRDLRIARGDIRDAGHALQEMRGADVVFHLAALIDVADSKERPESYAEVNTMGTINVLNAAMWWGVGRVIHTSTSEVYGSAQYTPIDEDHPIAPQSPYAASKASADSWARVFHRTYGLPVVTVRPFNTYGPRQSERAIIGKAVRRALDGRPLRFGNPNPRRDFTYVSDTVDGFLAAMRAPDEANGEVFNLGTGSDVSMAEVVRCVCDAAGCDRPVEWGAAELRRHDGFEVDRLLSANGKARRWLQWEPVVGLEDGIARTVESVERGA